LCKAEFNPSNSAGTAFQNTPQLLPPPLAVLHVCVVWALFRHRRFLTAEISWAESVISTSPGEVLRQRRRKKLEEALTVTPKAQCKRISQLLPHFSRQGHHDFHI